ncbi:hypothetical protein M5C72_04120 [Companilactobacillus allii]|uniref:Membrane protein 6-pyruvoyl-tetrahydropterin synthase-related domain-containing protein n=1 Tax=Companilactobacillus allii TaxID=1847728 RepID=A0A1P8Q3B0_9LACO|nr:hypothetical protein [Companilactobacillus allii]APX72333.1 hypothetical protein BTM29_07060 [Companilactobacillus allii]USQ69425.1 hypothetical protein M5C72_04120 [Companilactobacillus allii]
MNTQNHINKKTISVILLFFISIIIWMLWQFHLNYMIAGSDTFFHTQRIYEIRQAFINGNLPSWLNFDTFFSSGQAVNGMYPDFTLWPFIFITDMLSPIHQIIAIKVMIAMMTFVVTFLSLNKRYSSLNSSMAALIYTYSGAVLRGITTEFQPGVAIVLAFSFPLIFTFKDILESKRIDYILAIKVGLLMTIVINSHLLSAVAISMVAGVFLIVCSIKNRTLIPFINLVISGLIAVVLCLPLIYRLMTISKTGLLPPFGKGNVIADPISILFTNVKWNAKTSFSTLSLIVLLIVLVGFDKKKTNKLLPWLLVESVLVIFSTDLTPWAIFNHIPILNNFQESSWRFALFLGIVPIILLLENFKAQTSKYILVLMSILSLSAAIQVTTNYIYNHGTTLTTMTAKTKTDLSPNTDVKLTSSGINSEKILRTLIPDYAPDKVAIDPNSNGQFLSPEVQNLLIHHTASQNNKTTNLKKTSSTTNSVNYRGKNIKRGNVQLPIFGYSSLKYDIKVNNKSVKWTTDDLGFIAIYNPSKANTVNISVASYYPHIYPYMIWFSFVLFIALIGYVIYRS